MTEHEYEEWFNKYLGEVESLHSDSSKQGVLSFIPRKLHRWHWIVSCLLALAISTFLSLYLSYHYELSDFWLLSWSSNALLSFSIGLIASIFLMLYTNACNRNVGFYSVAIPLLEKRLSDMRKAYFDYTFKIQIRYVAEDYQTVHIRKVAIRPKEDLMQTASSIPVSLINIAEDMKRTPPRAAKVASVLDYYQAHGELDKPIVVRKRGDRYELVDKYLRYYVAVKLGLDQIQAIVINK